MVFALRCLAETTPSVLLVPPSVPGLWHIPQQYGKLLTCELHSRLYRYQPASEEKQRWGWWRPQMLNKDDDKTTRAEETQSFCVFSHLICLITEFRLKTGPTNLTTRFKAIKSDSASHNLTWHPQSAGLPLFHSVKLLPANAEWTIDTPVYDD